MINLILFVLLLYSNSSEKIKIKEPWMRVAAKGQSSALFMKIENTTHIADTLFKVEGKVSKNIEIHQTYQKDDMMGMRKVEFVIINPNSTFELKPRSYHIMLIKLFEDLKKGDEHEFILHFKNAGKVKIKAKVEEMKKMKQEHKH